jgi:hypothetical protein
MPPGTAESTMRNNPQRQFLRHTINVPLEVVNVSASARKSKQSVNVSYGGLAFESDECPGIGDTLQLRIATVDPPFEARGRVAWCRPEGDGFLVGVQFLDSSDAFQSRMVQQVCAIENYRKELEQNDGRVLSTEEAAVEWIAKFAGRFPDSETAA